MRTTSFLKLLSLWLLLLASQLGFAQTRIPREVHIGAIGGASLSQYSLVAGNLHVSQKLKQGYTGGIAFRYIEETLFGLQAELLMMQRGWADYYEEHPEWQYERTLTYLELPVMAHIYFKIGGRQEVSVDLGPKLGWFIYDDRVNNMPSDFGQPNSETSAYMSDHHTMDVTQTFDYGIQAGLGYEVKLNPKLSLQLQGRYYYGLGNIWPDTKADTFQQSSNQSIQIVMALWWRHTIRGKKVKRD